MTKQSKTTGIRNSIWWCDVCLRCIMQDLEEYYDLYILGTSRFVCCSKRNEGCWMKNTVISSKIITALVGK